MLKAAQWCSQLSRNEEYLRPPPISIRAHHFMTSIPSCLSRVTLIDVNFYVQVMKSPGSLFSSGLGIAITCVAPISVQAQELTPLADSALPKSETETLAAEEAPLPTAICDKSSDKSKLQQDQQTCHSQDQIGVVEPQPKQSIQPNDIQIRQLPSIPQPPSNSPPQPVTVVEIQGAGSRTTSEPKVVINNALEPQVQATERPIIVEATDLPPDKTILQTKSPISSTPPIPQSKPQNSLTVPTVSIRSNPQNSATTIAGPIQTPTARTTPLPEGKDLETQRVHVQLTTDTDQAPETPVILPSLQVPEAPAEAVNQSRTTRPDEFEQMFLAMLQTGTKVAPPQISEGVRVQPPAKNAPPPVALSSKTLKNTSRTPSTQVNPQPTLSTSRAQEIAPQVTSIPFSEIAPIGVQGNGDLQLLFPLTEGAITSSFGWRIHPISDDTRFHSGTDIGAAFGTPVVAALSGQVVAADYLGGYGLTVVLQHRDGSYQTLYAHLGEIFVRPGEQIKQGTVIGRVGSTGNSTGPHLHFEIRTFTTSGWVAINPEPQLQQALMVEQHELALPTALLPLRPHPVFMRLAPTLQSAPLDRVKADASPLIENQSKLEAVLPSNLPEQEVTAPIQTQQAAPDQHTPLRRIFNQIALTTAAVILFRRPISS